jgi:hypothetical protein
MRRRLRTLASSASVAATVALFAASACSHDGGDTSTSTASSSSSTTSASGTGGGAPVLDVCVTSRTAAPFGGSDACPAALPPADSLDQALASRSLGRCDVRFDDANVALSGWPTPMLFDAHRLPDFTPLHHGPLRLVPYGRDLAGGLDESLASDAPVSRALAELSLRRGRPLAGACFALGAYVAAPGDDAPLATSIAVLFSRRGASADVSALRASVAGIPLDLQARLAPVVGALDLASDEVEAALGPAIATASDRTFLARAASLYYPGGYNLPLDAAHVAKLDAVDVGKLTEAAALLSATIEAAKLADVPDATFARAEIDTPIGEIVLSDSSADHYAKGSAADGALLLFDLGGNDVYEVGAGAADAKHPISVAVDVRGSDHYGYAEVASPLDAGLLPSDATGGRYSPSVPPDQGYGPITLSKTPRQGSGNAGVGLLFDLGAESDTYRSLATSQGFGAAGVGVLYDAGGDDDYAAEAASQGAATFGVGLLLDRAGDDRYASFTLSQGFGGAEGAGALVDGAGDDRYEVDPGDPALGGHPLYFSPQLPGKGNSSMSQGAAQGRRPASASDAAFMAGGIGILRDAAGKDQYRGGVFAQGAGYWQGLGMLLDGGADADTYDALWYVQGSAAHFSLALFVDEGGDDTYDGSFTVAATSIGVGHDFSAALHLDLGGDDVYRAPGLSLGSGNINGIGLLVNAGGSDAYFAAGDPTLGAGNYSAEAPFGDPRQAAPTLGVFVDTDGVDAYTVAGQSRPLDQTTWSYEPQPYPPPEMVTTERGVGADASGGAVTFP